MDSSCGEAGVDDPVCDDVEYFEGVRGPNPGGIFMDSSCGEAGVDDGACDDVEYFQDVRGLNSGGSSTDSSCGEEGMGDACSDDVEYVRDGRFLNSGGSLSSIEPESGFSSCGIVSVREAWDGYPVGEGVPFCGDGPV